MKTKLLKFLLLTALNLIIILNLFGQTTYTTNPSENTYTSLTNSNTYCNDYTSYGQDALKVAVAIINENQARFLVVPESGSFNNSGTCYIKLDDACGSIVGQSSYSSGGTYVMIEINLTHTSGTKEYVAMTLSSTSTPWRNHTRPIAITAESESCEIPSGLHEDNLTSTSVKLDIPNTSGAQEYKFRWNDENGVAINEYTNYSYLNLSGLTPATTYEWKVKVQCSNGDWSDYSEIRYFTTLSDPKEITVISPNGGEIWYHGETKNVTWSTTGGVGMLRIAVRYDGNAEYLSQSHANTGSGTFTVPNTITSENCEVGVFESADPNINDYSDNFFRIRTQLQLMAPLSFGTNNLTVGETYSFTTQVKNMTSSAWEGSLYVKVDGEDAFNCGAYTISGNQTITVSGSFTPESSHAGSNVPISLYHFTSDEDNQGIWHITNKGSYSNPITVNISSPTPASLQLQSSMNFSSSNMIVGETYSFTTQVKNTGGTDWDGGLSVKVNGANAFNCGTYSIDAGQTVSVSGSFTPSNSHIGTNVPASLYHYTAAEDAQGIWNNTNQGSYSNPITVNISSPTPASLQLQSSMNFSSSNMTVGETYSFTAQVKNTGGTDWDGGLSVKVNGANAFNCGTYSIDAGQTVSVSGTFTPSNSHIGTNVPANLYHYTAAEDAQGIWNSTNQGSYSNPIMVNIEGGDCYFSDCSSTTNCGNTNYQDQTYDAVQYLCTNFIVEGSEGNALPDENITRSQLAKITMFGIFGGQGNVPDPLVTDYFPSPYADLQNPGTYYYRSAKALLYLDYGDGKTPFDRDRFNFFPEDNIERCLVLKVMLEAFDIEPSSSGTNPFTDFPSNADFYEYAKKAHDMGITEASEFRPYDYCTRAEAFIFLHRIMTQVGLPTINNTLDFSSTSFFIPGNYTQTNFSASKGMEIGNFNHYTKSSFSIPGRNVSLDFDHSYNSYITELPKEFYPISPLGTAWSHTYNSYIYKIEGADPMSTDDDRLLVFWPGGTIHSYTNDGGTFNCETEGVYDEFTQVSSYEYVITTKNQVEITFERISGSSSADLMVMTSIKDRNNNELQINYELGESDVPRIDEVQDPSGRKLQFYYHSGTNLLSRVSDPISRDIYFDFTNDQFTEFTDAKGLTTTYIYGNTAGTSNLLMEIELPKGNVITNTYNQRKLTSTRYNNNTPTTIDIDANYSASTADDYINSTVIVPQDGQNLSYNYEYNEKGRLTNLDGPPGVDVNSTYNDNDNPTLPTEITKNNVTVTVDEYDDNGNPVQVTRAGGSLSSTEHYEYNSDNDLTKYTDAENNITNFYYTNGNLTSVKDPMNNTTTITYNSHGQVESVTNPEGVQIEYGYNSYGNKNEVTIPALSLSSTMNYDGVSRVTNATNFNGQTTAYTFDDNDNMLTVTNALNHITTYGYDDNDNLTTITNAKGGVTSLEYFFDSDWLKKTTFQGNEKSYTYNDDGSLNTLTNPNGDVFTYSYDDAGNIINDGNSTYTYDAHNNLKTITKDGNIITYYYDDFKRIASVEYNDFAGNTIYYEYDDVDNLTKVTYPGNKDVDYEYDGNNRLITVTDWNNNETTYTYRADGQLEETTYPNGVKCVNSYDNAGRLTGITNKRSDNSIIASYTYTLDNLGNHTNVSVTEPYTTYPDLSAQTETYTYNNANRIQSLGSTNFTFDDNGNTLTKTGYTFNYDNLNNLTSVSGNLNATYTYDGAGNRRAVTKNGNTTRYVLDILGMSKVLMETDENGTATNYYVYGLGLISRVKPNNTTEYYIYDNRGSTVAMVDATSNANITHKYAYDDFGKITNFEETDFNPFRYVGSAGVMYEDSVLMFMRARYYDNQIGRFLSEDPIWSTNLYPYADNNPITGIDPKGTNTVFDRMSKSQLETAISKIEDQYEKSLRNQGSYDWQKVSSSLELAKETYNNKFVGIGNVTEIYYTKKMTVAIANELADKGKEIALDKAGKYLDTQLGFKAAGVKVFDTDNGHKALDKGATYIGDNVGGFMDRSVDKLLSGSKFERWIKKKTQNTEFQYWIRKNLY